MSGTGFRLMATADVVFVCQASSSRVLLVDLTVCGEVCCTLLKRALQARLNLAIAIMYLSTALVNSGTRLSEGAPSAPCSRAQTIARVGTTALRWGLTWVSTSVSWMAFRFARSCLCSSTLSMPSLMESHFKVPHHFWSFAGVTSSVTAWFMRCRTSPAVQGRFWKPILRMPS